jgi:all-trans-nonaprenyl-diphosphate synthase
MVKHFLHVCFFSSICCYALQFASVFCIIVLMTTQAPALPQPSGKASAQWQSVFALVQSDLEQVKASLKAVIPPHTQILAETVNASLTSGGKYLRPAMTLLMGLASLPLAAELSEQNRVKSQLIEVAAVSEMIHIATLLHDDVLDEADLRRGKATVRLSLGNKISVLSGDFLLAQASLKLAKLDNPRLVSIYAQVLADLCDGEVMQMTTSHQLPTSMDMAWEQYRHKSYCKTASLFAAGCEAAGVVNRLPEVQIQRFRDYGKAIGLAFQVVDDLLDYTSSAEKLGKPALGDLRLGLLNAPLLLALQSEVIETSELKKLVQAVFDAVQNAPEGKDSEAEKFETGEIDSLISQIQALLVKANALSLTQDYARDAIAQALSALEELPASEAQTALASLAQAVIERDA